MHTTYYAVAQRKLTAFVVSTVVWDLLWSFSSVRMFPALALVGHVFPLFTRNGHSTGMSFSGHIHYLVSEGKACHSLKRFVSNV